MIARRAVVTGHVQGVFFRAHVREAAKRAGASGWAENRPDGSVEIHAEGEPEAVQAVLEAARQGPAGARVDDLRAEDAEPEGCEGFASR